MMNAKLHHVLKIAIFGEDIAFCDLDDGLSILDAKKNMFESNFVDLKASIFNSLVPTDRGDHYIGQFLKIEGYFF